MTPPRLIERAFPLKQASLDSVHEKNVRHGHISTLHIWPARRPLAACRAALIATLLPDPGTPEGRKKLVERIGGTVVKRVVKKKIGGRVVDVEKEETVGGILHWGRESSPDLEWFRQEIRKAYGGRAPKVLDPFAGGGAIPLEAMRLGCEVTASDLNPVAWFILKCTLEYPQKLAGQKRPLPVFALDDPDFMKEFIKAHPHLYGAGRTVTRNQQYALYQLFQKGSVQAPEADLAWHVRAWGRWVLARARKDLEKYYPVVDGKPTVAYLWARTVACKNCRAAIPLLKTRWLCKKDRKRILLDLTPPAPSPQSGEGVADRPGVRGVPGYVYELCRRLRAEGTAAEGILWEVLRDRRLDGFKFRRQHPLGRYIADFYCAEARLVVEVDGPVHDRPDAKDRDDARAEAIRAGNLEILRLKNEEVEENIEKAVAKISALLPHPPSPSPHGGEGVADRPGVRFGIQKDIPVVGGNTAQRREHDKRIGKGTMSRTGASCPCCGRPDTVAMTMGDIRQEGVAGRLGAVMTAVVVEGERGKDYRLPTAEEIRLAEEAGREIETVFREIPFGMPKEPLPAGRTKGNSGFRVLLYGLGNWSTLFYTRQLVALGTFVKWTRAVRDAMEKDVSPAEWREGVVAYLALGVDRLADSGSTICHWQLGGEFNVNTFQRFALPMTWDFSEVNFASGLTGSHESAIEWVGRAWDHFVRATDESNAPAVSRTSATRSERATEYDVVLTDPPYYDEIAYSDVMDFFYVWLRRTLHGLSPEIDEAFEQSLSPKWDFEKKDGELIDDASRFDGDKTLSKGVYEDGMHRAFEACGDVLAPEGRLVIVFAHKHPDAWETLVAAIIRAGFAVDGSWPIQTERTTRMGALAAASLSSSVWLVCKKRPEDAKPGWDNRVLEEMRSRIYDRLREFWDAGIRGPDFVWAATGPALEAYSRHPVVKKANEPGKTMEVSEFLRAVRRIVVDFVVGRVLFPPLHGVERGPGGEVATGLDDVTTYYLLHRNDFRLDDAPAGASILYAVSCGLSDSALADQHDLLARTGGKEEDEEEDAGEAADQGDEGEEEGTGSKVKLRPWHQRKRKGMGYDADGRPAPLIDQVHRLMHLWKAGDVARVDDYLDERALRKNPVFQQLLQALIELSPGGNEERSLLESISNHVQARGARAASGQTDLLRRPLP